MWVSAAGTSGGRWSAHPWAARALRLGVFGLPVVASVALVQVVTSFTGVPTSSLWVFLGWWFGVSLFASAVVTALYALTRKLLPLSGLLGLALVFPDEAPSRFRLALATGTVETLQERLTRMREDGDELGAQEAAEILLQLVAALDGHDRITRGHAERVRGYAASLGRQIGLSADDLDRLNWSALLHDIGKLEVDTAILNKAGRPTEDEWAKLRRHPLDGELLVEPMRAWLGEWIGAVGYHHENWDGTGYPRGVAGEAIPLGGRIVAIADVYDVITSVRSYKEAASAAEARAELVRCAGTQFEPRLVRAFVDISLGRMRFLVGPLAWLSNAPLLVRLPLTPSLGATIGGVAALATAATATPAVAVQRPVVLRHVPAATTAVSAAATVASASHQGRRARRHHVPATVYPGPSHTAAPAVTETTKPPPRPAPEPPATTTTVTTAHPTAPPPSTTTTTTTSGEPSPAPRPPTTTTTASPSAPPPPVTTTTATTATTTTTTTATAPPSPAPHVNVAPSFNSGPDQAVLEDSGAHSAGWATGISPGPSSESAQTVTFVVANDNTSLFSSPPEVAPDGTLSYTAAADANGTAHVTVYAVDDGGTTNGGHDTSATQSFSITVAAVNDAPTFTPGASQTAVSLLGAETVDGWAKGISAGPPDEAGQTVTFKVSVSNPSLFAVQPQVSATGKLTYTPKALALGSATVTVTPVDNGGTGNGGQDTGTPRTFTITII